MLQLNLPYCYLKTISAWPNPLKTPVCIFYVRFACFKVEHLSFVFLREYRKQESQLRPWKVTYKPFWLSRALTGGQKTLLL